VQILAVAQVADDFTPAGFHRPKGWRSITVTFGDGPEDCVAPDAGPGDAAPDAASAPDARPDRPPPPDAGPAADLGAPEVGVRDATVRPDAGAPETVEDDGGCRCVGKRRGPDPTAGALILLVVFGAVRRRGGRCRA
jgi:hypothetical protein